MLKYTLGALAALTIVIATAFVIIAQVTEGDAGTGPAIPVIAVIHDDEFAPSTVEVERDQIIDLRFDNQSAELRTIIIGGEGVEVLPQLSTIHEEATISEIRSSAAIDVAPARSRAILVRFTREGEYEIGANLEGTFERVFSMTIVVK